MSITKYKLIFGTAREFHNVLWQTMRHYMTDASQNQDSYSCLPLLGRLGQEWRLVWFETPYI